MLNRNGIYLIIALLAVFAGLHIGFAPEGHDGRTTMTTLLGGFAFLLMTVAIVLSTRLRAAEALFGGLDRMYQVHKYCGVIAGLLVLLHFLGVPKALPAGVSELEMSLVPSAPMGMVALILLVISLALTLNRKIPYHRWRLPHKAMGLVYLLVVGHFLLAPPIFFERFGPSGILLICTAVIGILSYLYSIAGKNRRLALEYTIESVNALERATEIVLKPVGDNLQHKSGQFAFVEVQGKGWDEPHPFTISSAPGEDRLRFTMKVLGDWTRKVREELKAGATVHVHGPYGRFDMASAGRKQIWLAGGIGLTPFLSAVREMKPGDGREIHLVYAARNSDDAIFLDELDKRAAELGNVTLVPLFSDEGNFARVDIMKTKLPDPLDSYDYFLCGPRPMVNALMKNLKAEGVGRTRIHTEAFEFR
ncbi:ferredoxin reductase family protein [Hoeflea prorocentri]|uniref:Ferredoxin reductase family protein n=1 Tax=Hoeflea prorocentri TaxID=1922333 RepID=A0A9X3ZJQ9_9HYPH|nr:ferredoxin reductase family protein [Hoeflea prorocentri]MCY6383353.1 ferredoxin reductase family protein [Hoeflea prorocentri]MDA5401153.1 ferredoxin reductase family protein [Hoeflea prorocentri]